MIDFEKHQRLVYKVFNESFAECRFVEDDLIQEGLIALWNACKTYSGDKAAFSTYAMKCIHNAMGMYMRKENRKTRNCISLENPASNDDEESTLIDTIGCEEHASISDSIEFGRIMEIISSTPQHEMVLMKLQGMSQIEIARALGITQCSVSEQLRALYQRIKDKFEY